MPTDLCPLPPVNQREAFEVVKCPQKQQTKTCRWLFPPLLPAASCLMEGDSAEAARRGLGAPHLHPGPAVRLIGTVKSPHTRHKGEEAPPKGENKPLLSLLLALCAAVVWLRERAPAWEVLVGGDWSVLEGRWWLERGGRGSPCPCWSCRGFCWHSSWAARAAAPLWVLVLLLLLSQP